MQQAIPLPVFARTWHEISLAAHRQTPRRVCCLLLAVLYDSARTTGAQPRQLPRLARACETAKAANSLTMATNTYQTNGTLYRRSVRQGRKPQGLSRWNGRLTTASLDRLKAEAERLKPYYTVNDLVRIAVDNYVCTKLDNP